MSEKIKLGLTRNRLFEFDNCVCFFGETEESFDFKEAEKALKMLCLKEPILTSVVELEADGAAYIVTGKNQPLLENVEGDVQALAAKKKNIGFDFTKGLFSFGIINGKTLCVFAHTAVADVRSLLYLAKEFMAFYNKEKLSVEPNQNMIVSETNQLPSNVFSVVVDRLASGLEVGWQKKTAAFDFGDYKKAREKYFAQKSSSEIITLEISEDVLNNLKDFSRRGKTDVSSLVAFAFYEGFSQCLAGKRKYRKLNVQANERVFLEDFASMNVGGYNGFFAVEKKKNKKLPDTLFSNAVNFHKEIYKKMTNCFSVFYNEFLFMRLPDSFCDSQYIFCAGDFNHKYSKKLANTYGCANEVFGEFCAYNLNQSYWSGVGAFSEVTVSEPLKMRSSSLITFIENQGKGKVVFEYKENKIPACVAAKITEKAMEILEKLK